MPYHVDLNTICLRIADPEWPQSNVKLFEENVYSINGEAMMFYPE